MPGNRKSSTAKADSAECEAEPGACHVSRPPEHPSSVVGDWHRSVNKIPEVANSSRGQHGAISMCVTRAIDNIFLFLTMSAVQHTHSSNGQAGTGA